MRRIKGSEIRARREALGLTRADLAFEVDTYPGHLGKIERGEVERVKPALLARLIIALEVEATSDIAEAHEHTPSERWADHNDYTLEYTQELARDGRIEGAYLDESGRWHMEPDAQLLPPNDRARKRWREKFKRHGLDAQRQRRRLRGTTAIASTETSDRTRDDEW